jgi:acetyl-CoA C-acetyltransferase
MTEPVYVVDGTRTPFLKARNRPGPFAASDLAVQAGRALLTRMPFAPEELDEVILGCASPSPDEVNIGRVVALRIGCGLKVPAWTVMRNCASGMQALDSALTNIRAGRSSLVLAGGVDALSRAPLLYSEKMVLWFAAFSAARTFGQKAGAFLKLSPAAMLTPVIGIMKGLTDPVVGLMMGQTAENLAFRFGITRREMDAFAADSHRRVLAAQKAGHFDREIVPLYDRSGKLYPADDGVREDSTPENLSKLKPFFDRMVTSPRATARRSPTARRMVPREAAIAGYKLPVLGTIVDGEWAGLDPAEMGPVHAATPLCSGTLALGDVEQEINEAFAARVIACLKA